MNDLSDDPESAPLFPSNNGVERVVDILCQLGPEYNYAALMFCVIVQFETASLPEGFDTYAAARIGTGGATTSTSPVATL